ncbi:hypothetical protein ACOT1K_09205 [Providencia manganoxydans]|uniref:phage tail fiber protein n=1 Tax=Providencia manganoxydans TaxID=2923283 RepID=UPI003B9B2C7F
MREVKPTQKPVPSSDIKDLFFNSGLLDIWATSLERKYIDRFGNCHLTAAGMEWLFKELVETFKVDMNTAIVAAGYITIDSFQQGADLPNNELTQRNHILRDETTGEYYRWDGDLPKQVPAGSNPQSTGGIGKGAWVSVGDASLRSDLKNGDGSLIGVGNGTLKDAVQFVTPEMFGAVPWESDDIKSTDFVDSYQNLQDMFDSGYPVLLTKKYVTSKPLLIEKGIRIDGNGSNRCGIYKSTNTSSGMGEFLSPSGSGIISYDVDAVLIIKKPTQGFVGCLNWNGFRVSKCGDAYKENNHEYEGVGIFAPYISESNWTDVVSFGFKTPIYTVNVWLTSLTKVQAHGHEGFVFGGRGNEPDAGGTTLNLNNCWSTATGVGMYSYNFNNIWQVSANAIAAEYVGDHNHPSDGVINSNNSYVLVNGIDIEKAHVKSFIKSRLSVVDVSGINTHECYAKYADAKTYLINNRYSKLSLRNGNCVFFRDTTDASVNSNFANIVGHVSNFTVNNCTFVPYVNVVKTKDYIPTDNDFIIFCEDGGTIDVTMIPDTTQNQKQRTSSVVNRFMEPIQTKSHEEYVDANKLRTLDYTYNFVGKDAVNKGANGDSYIINMTNGNDTPIRNNSVQVEFNTQATKVMFRGARWGEEFGGWREFYTTVNTTKDSNGNLKVASPIVKVFADRIETNDESEGVTMQKLGTGHYLIKGVVGFNSDGAWGINNGFVIPQDHNGKNMVLIDYKVRPDGDIEVFVFHQQNADMPERFQNKRIKYIDKDGNPVYYENYEPCDVPESRWIDMRVEMPVNSIYNLKQAEAERLAKEEAKRAAGEEEAEKSEEKSL